MSEYVPADSPQDLSRLCAELLRASSELMQRLSKSLTQSQLAAMGRILESGGRIGVEASVDGRGENMVALVAVELEGRRYLLAKVASANAGNPIEH